MAIEINIGTESAEKRPEFAEIVDKAKSKFPQLENSVLIKRFENVAKTGEEETMKNIMAICAQSGSDLWHFCLIEEEEKQKKALELIEKGLNADKMQQSEVEVFNTELRAFGNSLE